MNTFFPLKFNFDEAASLTCTLLFQKYEFSTLESKTYHEVDAQWKSEKLDSRHYSIMKVAN